VKPALELGDPREIRLSELGVSVFEIPHEHAKGRRRRACDVASR
jgi:hypothetical protein